MDLTAVRLRLLGQSMRLRIVMRLASGPACVQELADELVATQQNVSKHLGWLQRDGVVQRRPEGSRVWYSLADPAAPLVVEAAAHDVLGQLRGLGERIASASNGPAGSRQYEAQAPPPGGAAALQQHLRGIGGRRDSPAAR